MNKKPIVTSATTPFTTLTCPCNHLKEFQKGRLRPRGALDPPHGQGRDESLHLLQIQVKVLHPQGAALADCGQLRRLQVSESQGGQVLMLFGKPSHDLQKNHQSRANENQTLLHLHEVGVVAHVATGGTQVDDGHGCGTGHSEGVHMLC
jgi:hypothetical protein